MTRYPGLPKRRLADGVTRGLADYVRDVSIADDYDDYFAFNSLFEFDRAVLDRWFREPGRIADLGCGTGRLLLPFMRRGFTGLAVDLSPHMLRVVGEKAALDGLAIDRVLANLVELGCLADGCVDYAMCMFSTLGMIRGRVHRGRVLAHVRRIVRPGGTFVLHVHNRWYNLFNPQGRVWLATNWLAAMAGRDVEPGDRYFDYRGVPNVFVHSFTRCEILGDVRAAGFRVVEVVSLDTERRHALRHPWLLGRIRANGWIVACR